jgi:hypothetical protein
MKVRTGTLIIIVALIGAVVVALAWKTPGAVTFKTIARDSVLGTLTWLFVVALFIERAVEVIVSTLRDADAALLEHAVETAQEAIDAQAKVTPGAVPYLQSLHVAQKNLLDYRSDTKELALCVSFIISLFVSVAGVRAFSLIANNVPDSNWLFAAADIVVTGAVLAGGTDAIHQMMNVVMNFFNNAADKAKGT